LILVVASNGRTQVTLPEHTLAGVTVDATLRAVGRVEVATRSVRGVAAVLDTRTVILAKVRVAEVGIDALAVLADAWLAHVVTDASGVYGGAEPILAYRRGTYVAVVSTLSGSIALDAFADVVAERVAVWVANLVDGLDTSTFALAGARVARTIDSTWVLVVATDVCAQVDFATRSGGSVVVVSPSRSASRVEAGLPSIAAGAREHAE
jgi:hypothetical protein